jgi:hypothetical protein
VNPGEAAQRREFYLRLVMGTSMAGGHTWLWAETYPTMMDALMPLASLPVQISGRNRVWRDMVIDILRSDPGYDGGEYTEESHDLTSGYMTFAYPSQLGQVPRGTFRRERALGGRPIVVNLRFRIGL